jgi:sterol desaturase/sphingolipid hydroxylase (fatty acid hydroxylase superfamily)
MNAVASGVSQVVEHPQLQAILHTIYYRILLPPFLQPHEKTHPGSLSAFALADAERIAQTFVWFLLIGMVIYAFSVRSLGRWSAQRFSYPYPIDEPGEKFSMLGGLKYMMPRSFYKHPSFRFDMTWLPFSIVLGFFGLLGTTIGAGVVQGWLLHRFGRAPLAIPEGGLAIALQVIIMLVARDFGRFVWHYQGHTVPFFWEFHKGHHSAEVLHPFGVRTHPVDMFIRNTYTGLGGGLIAGSLIYLLGMSVSITAASYVATVLGVLATFEHFEHSHVRLPFGKALERVFYAPYLHHFHHGARPEHMNVNLGISGGLIFWDKLFGTYYRPTQGEQIVWGASLEELGEHNPHRTLKGFVVGPFIEAFRTLRRRSDVGDLSALSATSSASQRANA